jgi:DEAD/DEAH box helicase
VPSSAEKPKATEPVGPAGLQPVVVPDLWQQEAVTALRAGKDVVVHAPTGAGKTLVFELWSKAGKNRGQAIYTVPTRALANDKLSEWRSRGWNVGIATGDLADNLDAPILVATLETQKNRLIRGDGPTLLVVDEYQMLGDEDRGLNYELALALAPEHTQLLLLSGSVANPDHVAAWLRRLGRDVAVVRHTVRPVPLDEVLANELSWHLPSEIKGYWPRLCAKALAENLGPILLFAPRRAHAEEMAADLARQLPNSNPLVLSDAQRRLVGENVAKMLRSRVAYHHSGLSYAVRAGVIEPLAKAGQLRVVVATMGLAAGINFSLRSVAVSAATYRRDGKEIPIRADEILQMFGRAGRRGLDETGYVLVSANELRIRDGHPCNLARSGMVDWSALLGLMAGASDQGKEPYVEAVRVQQRLFTTKPIILGVEESLKNLDTPCGLLTDAERARHVRRRHREMLNSAGEWESYPEWQERPLRDISVPTYRRNGSPADPASGIPAPGSPTPDINPDELPPPEPPGVWQVQLRPALTVQAAIEKVGQGGIASLSEGPDGTVYGRSMIVADKLADGRLVLAKWVRRLINWNGRETSPAVFNDDVRPLLEPKMRANRTPVIRFVEHEQVIAALVSLELQTLKAPVDRHGVALWRPKERDVLPPDCARCSLTASCRQLSAAPGTALTWRQLGLVDVRGHPSRRGRVVSFFSGGDGLAVAAALEDHGYALDDLVYDLANLEAGFRFCGLEDRWGGRLSYSCRKRYGPLSIEGYLECGAPPKYGSGAETVVRSIHKDPHSKARFATQFLGAGDIDRVIIEWRSLLRQIAHAPKLDWERWTGLQTLAKSILHEVQSPTETVLPPLEYNQTRRIDHRLVLRRH